MSEIMKVQERLLAIKSAEELRETILEKYAHIGSRFTKVFIFGAACLGQEAAGYCASQGINVDAFIDNDINKQGTIVNGVEVISLASVPDKKAIILVASGFLADICDQLKEAGFANVIPFPILSFLEPTAFPFELSNGMISDLIDNKDRYLDLYNMLADEQSKRVLETLLDFRLTMNPSLLADIGEPVGNRYFDNVLGLTNDEVFVDGGAYNGDTAEAFLIKKHGEHKKMLLFEPDANLLEQARIRLKHHKDIEFYEYGLYSGRQTLQFNATGEQGGSIYGQGNIEINVVALDEFIQEKLTFLKLDVEGAEKDALRGAAGHIIDDRMKLAVCVYHQPSDLWKIPFLLTEINPNLRLYIRQYSRALFETVLYAVPSTTDNTN